MEKNNPNTNLVPTLCMVCGKQFKKISNLHIHMAVHQEKKPFECKICSASFKYTISLKYHIASVHEGITFRCDILCASVFRHKSSFK